MFSHSLDNQVMIGNVVDIMKAKDQWEEGSTKVKVEKFTFDKCQVYLIEVNCISSTMILSENWPKQLLKTGQRPAIFAFIASKQTAGRGQRQNQWLSPEGNLYLTLLISIQFTYFPYLPMIAVGNLFKIIKTYLDEQKTQSITKIKWINDILIDFEKVSGVLIKNEMVGQCFYTQIGIGVNIKQLPSQLLFSIGQPLTYLEKYTKTNIQIKQFSLKLIQSFIATFFTEAVQDVKLNSKQFYQTNLAYLNKEVLLYDYKYEKILASGIFKGINEYGHAIIQGSEKPYAEGRMKLHHSAF